MYSVVIPVYNSSSTIVRVLESVRKQTRFDLIEEILLINDGSSDNSAELIKKYAAKYPEMNIRLFEQSNKGASAARNVGLKNAKADWIALLDSDDVWAKNKIERQSDVIEKHPEIVFLGCCDPPFKIVFNEHYGLYKANIKDICWKSFPVTPSIVFRRSALKTVGYFNEKKLYAEDIDFYQRFCVKFNYYILCEKLVKIGIQKKAFASSGLSSNLYKMHLGRCDSLRKLYYMDAISSGFYLFMQGLNWIKFFRRYVIVKTEIMKQKGDK